MATFFEQEHNVQVSMKIIKMKSTVRIKASRWKSTFVDKVFISFKGSIQIVKQWTRVAPPFPISIHHDLQIG